MAIRRMFSLQVADTDSFIELSPSAQSLYFHLGMRADDDGFVSGPKRIARMMGSGDDALEELVAKRFTIGFPSGVMVMKHWLIHNTIRKDRYTPTKWVKEMAQLRVDEETGKYQLISEHPDDGQPSGNQKATNGVHRLGKDRLGKGNTTTPAKAGGSKTAKKKTTKKATTKAVAKKTTKPAGQQRAEAEAKSPEDVQMEKDIAEVIKAFETHGVNAGASRWYGQKVQREACRLLIKQFGMPLVMKVVAFLPTTNTRPAYECPSVTTPSQLLDKWHLLEQKLAGKKASMKPKMI
jgi:hypothetical protein